MSEIAYSIEDDKLLERIKNIIIKTVSPQKIILFGSRSRKKITKNSDYDILIIKDNIDNERMISKKVNYQLLNEQIKEDIDFIGTTTEKWNKNMNNVAFIYKQIHAEGVILYE